MRVLVDTCIWSLSLRQNVYSQNQHAEELRRLITGHAVDIIGPIRQEVLSGIKNPVHFERLESHLAAFPDLQLHADDYITAAKFFNICRTKGIQGSNTDFLICSTAVRHDLAIFTTDRDFANFAKYLPIVLHEPGKVSETMIRYRRAGHAKQSSTQK